MQTGCSGSVGKELCMRTEGSLEIKTKLREGGSEPAV